MCAAISTASEPRCIISDLSVASGCQGTLFAPWALIPIRQINSAISARTERTIFQTLGMHPSERPATVRELRTLLYGSSPPRPTLTTGSSTITPQLPLFHSQLEWSEVFRQNSILIGAALLLLMIAIVVSL